MDPARRHGVVMISSLARIGENIVDYLAWFRSEVTSKLWIESILDGDGRR